MTEKHKRPVGYGLRREADGAIVQGLWATKPEVLVEAGTKAGLIEAADAASYRGVRVHVEDGRLVEGKDKPEAG